MHTKKINIVSLILVLLYTCMFRAELNAQNVFPGNYFIKNYNDKHYKLSQNQTWCVLQDSMGIMYFGNNNGLLEFDGTRWRVILTTNQSVVRSMALNQKGQIYIGAKNEIGVLKPDSTGMLEYASLLYLLPKKERSFGDVWQTFSLNGKIIFRTSQAIMILDNNQFRIIKSQTYFHTAYKIGNRILVKQKDLGIFELIKSELKFLPRTEKFAGDVVYTILPYNKNELLIVSKSSGLLIYDSQNILTQFRKPENVVATDEFLKKNQNYCGITINDTLFALGTIQNGLILINKKGEILKKINKESGLQGNTVWNLYLDKQKNIWAALNDGISHISINSPFTILNESNGIEGTVYSATRIENTLYAGTVLGVYSADEKNNFKIIDGTDGPSWSFAIIDDKVYCCHFEGIFLIDNGKTSKIADLGNSWNIVPYKTEKGIYIVGTINGIYTIQDKNKSLRIKQKIDGFEKSARRMAVDLDESIWICDEFDGIYNLRINDSANRVESMKLYTRENGLPGNVNNQVFSYRDVQNIKHIIFGTEKGFYYFDKPLDLFKPYEKFNSAISEKGFIDKFVSVGDGKYLFQMNSQLGGFSFNKEGQLEVAYKPFSKFKGLYIENINPFNDQGIMLCTKEGIIIYNSEYNLNAPVTFSASISQFLVGDSIISSRNMASTKCTLRYKKQNYKFIFSSDYYEDPEKTNYSYTLEGFDDDNNWSEWSPKTEKEYTHLWEGSYTFKVKALNIYAQESEIARFQFTVLPPWYRSLIAYIIYLLFFIAIITLGVNINTRRLKAQNVKLEILVNERTAEIELQKEEIQSQTDNIVQQAHMLELANIELEKLSIVASETDNAITIMDKDGNFEWVNNAFSAMYEFTLEQFIATVGKNIFECTTDPSILNKLNQCITDKKSVIYEFETQTRSGKRVNVQTTVTPILGKQNEIKKLISIDTDISELKKANNEIKRQKQEITDSIIYAKRIQTAMLPPEENILKNLLEHFIIYLPRDIVSGDFYWLKKIGDTIIIVLADCTGHGVPGAFMSMMGITLLIEITQRREIIEPAQAMNVMREELKMALRQSGKEQETDDGINLGMVAINLKKLELQFAGAYNSLYMFKKNKLSVIKADRMPIGIHLQEKGSFTNHKIKLEKNDMFYLFTDGFSDQFGGPDGKRFTRTQLKNLLPKIGNLPPQKQGEALLNTFNNWKGSEKQVDDVSCIGFKI